MKEDEEECGQTDEHASKLVHSVHCRVHHFCPAVVHDDAKHGHEGLGRARRTSTHNIDRCTYPRERLELLQVLDEAEQLHADRRGDEQQAHGEENQTAEFLARTEDLAREEIDLSI